MFREHYIDRLKIATISLKHYQPSEYAKEELSERENLANDIINHIVALANTKGGKLIVGYSEKHPDEYELEGEDIGGLIDFVRDNLNQVESRSTVEDIYKSLIDSVQIESIFGRHRLVFKVNKGPHPPYIKPEHIYLTEEEKNLGDNKRWLREFDLKLSEYKTTAYKRVQYRERQKAIKFEEGYLTDPEAMMNNNYFDNSAYIKIEDRDYNYQDIYQTLVNHKIIKEAYDHPGNYITYSDNHLLIKGSIKSQAVGFYIYLNSYARNFFDFDDQVKERIAEVVFNSLMHRDYSNEEPIEVRKARTKIVIITPGSLHPDVNIEDLQLGIDTKITKKRRNPDLYKYRPYDLKQLVDDYRDNPPTLELIDRQDSFIIRIQLKGEFDLASDDKYEEKRKQILKILYDLNLASKLSPGLTKKSLMNRVDFNTSESNFRQTYLGKLREQGKIRKKDDDEYIITPKGRQTILK